MEYFLNRVIHTLCTQFVKQKLKVIHEEATFSNFRIQTFFRNCCPCTFSTMAQTPKHKMASNSRKKTLELNDSKKILFYYRSNYINIQRTRCRQNCLKNEREICFRFFCKLQLNIVIVCTKYLYVISDFENSSF